MLSFIIVVIVVIVIIFICRFMFEIFVGIGYILLIIAAIAAIAAIGFLVYIYWDYLGKPLVLIALTLSCLASWGIDLENLFGAVFTGILRFIFPLVIIYLVYTYF